MDWRPDDHSGVFCRCIQWQAAWRLLVYVGGSRSRDENTQEEPLRHHR